MAAWTDKWVQTKGTLVVGLHIVLASCHQQLPRIKINRKWQLQLLSCFSCSFKKKKSLLFFRTSLYVVDSAVAPFPVQAHFVASQHLT